MANIRVKSALDKLQTEINKIAHHVALYSGIDKNDAMAIERMCDDIATTAAQIGGLAREAYGNQSGRNLGQKVRRALGYTTP